VVAALTAIGIAGVVVVNHAQNGLDVQFHAFQDSRGVTVMSPDVTLSHDLNDRNDIRVRFGVDAISAASDSCARCHPDGARNGRAVIGATLVRKYGDMKVTAGGEFSGELFYKAVTALGGISRELNNGNTTLAGGLSYSFNQPQLHPSEETEQQHAIDAYASVTQSWTRRTITQFGYELNQVNGYQTNPFLRTQVNGVWTVGNHPDLRTRQALTARIRQALSSSTFLEADYRYYHDTWAIDSTAFSVGVNHHFSPKLLIGFSYRNYDQTAAYFYAPTYTGSPMYYTADFRLFPFDSGLYTGKMVITPAHGLLNMPEGTALTLQYERYSATTAFQSAIFTAGIRVPLH